MKRSNKDHLPAVSRRKIHPSPPATRKRIGNHFGRLLALGAVILAAGSQSASAQVATAGNLIANLQSSDLDGTSPTWVNQATGLFSVGDFTTIGGSNSNVQTINGFKGLYINTTSANAARSAVNVPASITGNGSFTVEEWVYTNNLYSGFDDRNTVAAYGNNTGGINFGYAPASGNGSNAFNPGNFNDLGYQTSPPTGAWTLVDFTYDGPAGTATVYINGNVNVTGHLNALATNASQFYVGTQVNQNDPFAGYIGAVRVEDGVLSQSAIQGNYALGVGGTVVPEPGTMVGVVLGSVSGLFFLSRVRRRKA